MEDEYLFMCSPMGLSEELPALSHLWQDFSIVSYSYLMALGVNL